MSSVEDSRAGSSRETRPAPPPLETMFATGRTPPGQLAALCVYFPLGVVLALLRFFICVHAFIVTLILPKNSKIRCYVVRAMCTVLGLVVVEEDKNRDPEARVFVANHISVVDHWILDMLTPCVLPSVWDLPSIINWGHIYRQFGSSTGQPNVADLKAALLQPSADAADNTAGSSSQSAASQQNSQPQTGPASSSSNSAAASATTAAAASAAMLRLLAFPEGATTNGSVGLLQFSQRWPFELDAPVQPVALKATRSAPVRGMPLCTLDSGWLNDVMWLLFTPWTTFRVVRLPAVRRGRDETPDEFASRVADALAAQLGVRTTPHTCADKAEFIKRRQTERLARERRHEEAQALANPALVRMAAQVKEVLPDVPLAVIARDLQETRNVDATISRIVDGIVRYVPEKVPPPQPSPQPASSNMAPLSELIKSAENAQVTFNTSASNFGNTAEERFLSYQERKARLIENARLRYIQKHGLKL